MTLVIWSFGFITGIFLFLFASFLFIFKLLLQPKLHRKLPEFIKPKPLSQAIINEIRQRLTSTSHNESAVWLNGILNWFFLNLTDSSPVKQGLRQIISEIVVDLRRSPLGYFIVDSELKSVEIGGAAPRIENAKIITGSSLKEPSSENPLTLQFDLDYEEGDCRLEIVIVTIFKTKLLINLIIKSFKGSICLVIQDKTIHLCFIGEPSKLKVETNVAFVDKSTSSFHIPILNRLISSEKLIKKGISAACSFPNFLNQWYRAGPEQPPYPWDPRIEKDPELLYTWRSKSE